MSERPQDPDREVDEEIRFHLEMETEKNRRNGLSERDARLAAERSFGGVRRVQEEVRDLRPHRALKMLVRDLKYGRRSLRRAPAYALTTIFTLSLAVGVCAAMLTFVHAALLRPLPYARPDRVMTIWEANLATGEQQLEVSPGNFLDWETKATAFASMALAGDHGFDIRVGERVISVPTGRVSEQYFQTLGVRPLAGRTFEPSDFDRGAESRIVLSQHFWQSSFGGDRSLIGKTIEVDGKPSLVLGIVPDDIDPSAKFEVYGPLILYPGEKLSRTGHWMYAVGRLRDGVTREQASRDLDRVAQLLAREYPATNEQLRVRLIPLREQVVGKTRKLLLALATGSALLLLLACANIAALSLARGAARRRELAVRVALGATTGRIVRQLATEGVLLNGVACSVAALVAFGVITCLSSNAPEGLRRMSDVHAGAITIAALVVMTLFTTALSGVLPAMRLVRSGLGRDIESSRRDSGLTRSEGRLQGVLVVTQIAIALLLLTGAGLLTRSLQRLTANDLGFDPRGVATIQMYLYDLHPKPVERVQFVRTSLAEIRTLPGVTSVGATTALPFDPATAARGDFEIVGTPRRPGESRSLRTTAVTPGYFATMRTQILAGRDFTEQDGANAPLVAILNEAAARRYWFGRSPIGAKVRVGIMGPPREWTIAGVVKNTRDFDYAEEPAPQIYVPAAQGGVRVGGLNYVARSTQSPRAIVDAMQQKIWRLTPSQAIAGADVMTNLVGRSLQTQRFALFVIAGFGVVALVLSCAGLFGLLTYVAARRRGEVGVRMALGATPRKIERLFIRRGLTLAGAGIAAGLLLSMAFTRVLESFLYRTSPFDPVTISGVVASMALVAFFASWVPARRISSLEPSSVLRGE